MKIELSDTMLLAYLEGEVTQSQAAAIEAALAASPAPEPAGARAGVWRHR